MEPKNIASVTPVAKFYAFLLVSVIGLKWNIKHAITNQDMFGVVREFLTYSCGDDEWLKWQVLNFARDETKKTLYRQLKTIFPSLLEKGGKMKIKVPTELEKDKVTFDIDRIHQFRDKAREIKKGLIMEDTTQTATPETNNTQEVSVNFFLPHGMDPNALTIENYREITGKRFRMTKDQKNRSLTREQAFDESKARAVALADTATTVGAPDEQL